MSTFWLKTGVFRYMIKFVDLPQQYVDNKRVKSTKYVLCRLQKKFQEIS